MYPLVSIPQALSTSHYRVEYYLQDGKMTSLHGTADEALNAAQHKKLLDGEAQIFRCFYDGSEEQVVRLYF